MSTNTKSNKMISRWREGNAEVYLLGSHEQRNGVSTVRKKKERKEKRAT